MKITDTSEEIFSAYKDGHFDLDLWESYMDRCVPGAKDICLSDMRSCIDTGYSWEKDLLPVLENVISSQDKLSEAVASFRQVTSDLEMKILSRFGRSVDVDVVLYLGLCNGAGWVTEVNGKTSVLLGIEKILELSWCDTDHMNGLILHELDIDARHPGRERDKGRRHKPVRATIYESGKQIHHYGMAPRRL